MSHRSASVLAVLLLACGSSVPPPNAALAPGLVPTEEPLLRELCPGVAGREPGDYASVVALYGRFHGTEDLALRRSLLCAPETTHRGFAHGGYGYASRVFETDAARGIALFAALAREYAEPQALGDLALAHAGGILGSSRRTSVRPTARRTPRWRSPIRFAPPTATAASTPSSSAA
jgi:hypothetical protein